MFRNDLEIKRNNVKKYKSFEVLETVIKGHDDMLRICTIYRPGIKSNTANAYDNTKMETFLEEFSDYLDSLISKPGKPILCGDLNFHLEDNTNVQANKFKTLLKSQAFVQHVQVPTHNAGGILDVVLTRENITDAIQILNLNVKCDTGLTSDHYLIYFDSVLQYTSDKSATWEKKYVRNFRDININAFKYDICVTPINDPTKFQDIDTAVNIIENSLSCILDKHAPIQERNFKVNKKNIWWNSDCQKARCERRKAERKYKKN